MLIVRDFAAGRGEPLRRIAELDGDLLERLLRIAFETPQRFAERLAVERIATGGAREVSEVLRFLAEAEIVEAPEHAQLAIDRRVLREQASPWRYRDGEPFNRRTGRRTGVAATLPRRLRGPLPVGDLPRRRPASATRTALDRLLTAAASSPLSEFVERYAVVSEATLDEAVEAFRGLLETAIHSSVDGHAVLREDRATAVA